MLGLIGLAQADVGNQLVLLAETGKVSDRVDFQDWTLQLVLLQSLEEQGVVPIGVQPGEVEGPGIAEQDAVQLVLPQLPEGDESALGDWHVVYHIMEVPHGVDFDAGWVQRLQKGYGLLSMMSTEPLDGLSQTEHLGADGKIVVDKRLHGVPQFLDRLAGDDQVVGEGEVVPVSQGIADFEMAVGNRLLGCRSQEEAEALAVTDLAQVGEEPDGFQRCPEQQGAFQVAGSRVGTR